MTALRNISTAALVGLSALVFSALYLVSDVIEYSRAASPPASSG